MSEEHDRWGPARLALARLVTVAARRLIDVSEAIAERTTMPTIPPGAWGGQFDPQPAHRCRKCGAPTPWPGLCQTHEIERRADLLRQQQAAAEAISAASVPVTPSAPAPAPAPVQAVPVSQLPAPSAVPKRRGRPRKITQSLASSEPSEAIGSACGPVALEAMSRLRQALERDAVVFYDAELIRILRSCSELMFAASERLAKAGDL